MDARYRSPCEEKNGSLNTIIQHANRCKACKERGGAAAIQEWLEDDKEPPGAQTMAQGEPAIGTLGDSPNGHGAARVVEEQVIPFEPERKEQRISLPVTVLAIYDAARRIALETDDHDFLKLSVEDWVACSIHDLYWIFGWELKLVQERREEVAVG